MPENESVTTNKKDKWSIQISKNIALELKKICNIHGIKMYSLVQTAIIKELSGSYLNKN